MATKSFGASPTALAVTALHSLANASFWKSAAINFSTTGPVNVQLQVVLVTAASGAGSATGYANVYMACSGDNSQYDSNISAGDAAWSSTNPTTAEYAKSLLLLGRIPMGTTQTASYTWAKTFFLDFAQIPKYAVIVVENLSNKALAASGSAVTYLQNTTA